MKRKEMKFGAEYRESLKKVSTQIGLAIGNTLGPGGRDYLTPEGPTNDGRSILSHIRFDDECDDALALAFHEVANKVDEDVGDGTTTATVITCALAESMVSHLPDIDVPVMGKKSVMELSQDLEVEKDKAIAFLLKKSKPVETLEELEQVAFTAMQDRDAAKIIAEVVFKGGKDSYTALAEGFSGKIETAVQAGIEMPLNVVAPFMCTEGKEAIYSGRIPVLVANHLFDDYREMRGFMQSILDSQKKDGITFPALMIVGKQFSIPFVQAVFRVLEGSNGSFKILLVANSHLSDELFEDTAAFCGAQYIDTHPRTGKKIDTVTFKDCGMVQKIVAGPKGTVFFEGHGTSLTEGETTRVQSRVLEIKTQLAKETDPKKRTAMERRIAEFQGGKVTVYVDAKTLVEKHYLKLKVQDCMNSCKAALEGGRVRGGGISLKEVAEELGFDSLLYKALKAPYERVQANAGGIDIADDVFDSYLVAKSGIENAVSVIKSVIRIEGIIADHPQSLVEDLQTTING